MEIRGQKTLAGGEAMLTRG